MNSPDTAIIHLTNVCNLSCPGCYASGGEAKEKELNFDEWIYCFKKLSDNGIESAILLGGEPMLIPKFLDLLETANRLFKKVEVQTNATVVPINFIEFIKNKNITRTNFFVSIDNITDMASEGKKKQYEDLLRGEGVLEQAILTIKILKKNNIPVGIRSTLFNNNNYLKIIELSKELDVPLVFVRFLPVGRGEHGSHPSIKRLKEVYKTVNSSKNVTLFDCPYYIYNETLFLKFKDKFLNNGICPFISKRRISITSEGNVNPCHMIDIHLGNILKDDYRIIMENLDKTIEKFRSKKITEKCSNCSIQKYCNGGCQFFTYKNSIIGDTQCPI